MKTSLPKCSQHIQSRINEIVHGILKLEKDKIAKIILFGSYARGDWVEDEYMEYGRWYYYQSDLDILVIFKKGHGPNIAISNPAQRIEKFTSKFFKNHGHAGLIPGEPRVSMQFETVKSINKQLDIGRYYFTDIKKEGVLLYDSGEFELAEARDLPWEEAKEIAQYDYDNLFLKSSSFIKACKLCINENDLNTAAFQLHQATETLYHTIYLVFGLWKLKFHDLVKLKKVVVIYNEKELGRIFNYVDAEHKRIYQLLIDAYIKARYDRSYNITEEELNFLIPEVEKLRDITKKMCEERLKL